MSRGRRFVEARPRLKNILRTIRNETVHLERRTFGRFVLTDVPPARVYTGGRNGDRPFDFRRVPVSGWHPSYALPDSPHVSFLRQFKEVTTITADEFRGTDYFRFGVKDIAIYGNFFGITDPEALVHRAQRFLDLYRAIRDGRFGRGFVFVPGESSLIDCFMQASTIPDSDAFLIRGGHHRFAVFYVLGYQTVRARITGSARISMDDIRLKWEIYTQAGGR